MIATYQYYTDEYRGKRIHSEGDFEQFSIQAQRDVEGFTLYRVQEDKFQSLPEKVQIQVKDCICAVAEIEYAVEQNEKVAQGAIQSGVVKSRSAGAVSESYNIPKSQYADISYQELERTKCLVMQKMLLPREGVNLISRVIR